MPFRRSQTAREEIANAASHGIGIVLAGAALPLLLSTGSAAVGTVVFCGTMLLLYLASTLHHAWPAGVAKERLNRLDHGAIYLFIAGSSTPFVLAAAGDSQGGWTLFCLIWALALSGCAMELSDRLRHPIWSTALYLATGWLAVVAATMAGTAHAAMHWLLVGGLGYTVGALVFLVGHRVRYGHCVWHLCVLGGSASHVVAVSRLGV